MKRKREISSGEVSIRSVNYSGDVSRKEIRSGKEVSRSREIKSGDLDVSRNLSSLQSINLAKGEEINETMGDVSRMEINGDLDVSRHPYLSSQSVNLLMGIKSGKVSRCDIRSCDVRRREIRSCAVSLKPLSQSTERRETEMDNFNVSRNLSSWPMDVTRGIRSVDVSFRSKGSEGECTRNDLETERRRDKVFSNLLLSRHRRSLADGNEHDGTIVASCVGSHLSVDDGILCEILSRLPVRSLLRFKSVCKRWLSLIKHDRHFINLHFTRLRSRPNILFITPLQKQISGGDGYWYQPSETPRQSILLADISSVLEGSSSSTDNSEESEAIIRNVRMTTDDDWFVYDLVLKPVNGSVCFIDRKAAAVRIYNVSTREVTQWIKSTILAEEKNRFENEGDPVKFPIYQFGFDPSTMEHKVFCFWRVTRT
ncbi:uncharacterized protein LOC113281938 [Papaver somniferum]|uniref:uncharacterized protein LOC113281938 n=1 Tax=Papaver somniferum TaxID=3469 RepID=UPI000E6FEC83|nr:uncharacterized protein LOC113281938 [Papaver somniferum]XP_026386634.1 uncharacterized protein LOC113281938 [Papaver somniferum]XP_026386635.1 uncharacterized protein LOC113281938 [Papaver somniferum]XP_026386636.1 uncharacterized protein LOC113281938 [Papaver somniferum]